MFPSSVLIVYAHPRLHTLGAAGPTAGQVFAGGIFIAVHQKWNQGFKCTIATPLLFLCLGLSKNVLPGAICSATFKMSDITHCRHIKDGIH